MLFLLPIKATATIKTTKEQLSKSSATLIVPFLKKFLFIHFQSIMSQEIENTINDLQKTFQEYWNNEQLDKLMTLYHPDAVLVGKGQWAVYGRDGILEKFKSFFVDGPLKLTLYPQTTVATEDGSYAVQKGQVEFDSAPGKQAPYEQVFKKDSDGHYLIYHDEFEP